MNYDWTSLVSDFCASVISVATFLGALKKWPWLLKGVTYIEQHAGEIVKIGEAIAESPAGAMVKQALHNEVDKANEKLRQSEIGRLVLVGLHSFNADLADLSEDQKTAIVHIVKTQTNANEDEIRQALDAMQKAAQDFSQLEVVKAANLFTEAKKPKANGNISSNSSGNVQVDNAAPAQVTTGGEGIGA